MNINLLKFNIAIGKTKPETIVHSDTPCPFCDVANLTNIVATDGDIIFLHNKYNVLDGSDQFVLIEGKDCHTDMPGYSLPYMTRLLAFGLRQWQRLLADAHYQDVLFFKNHGFYSGGTIQHPHMQIVALKKIDSSLLFDATGFDGLPVQEANGVRLTLATRPRLGFGEFNFSLQPTLAELLQPDSAALTTLAVYMQQAISFICSHFAGSRNSYNVFFYHQQERIFLKILPRFATSPLFIGYDIRLLPSDLPLLAEEFNRRYYI